MSDIQQGDVLVSMPEGYSLPENAGKMEADEVRRVAKPPENAGGLPEQLCELFQHPPNGFKLPSDVTEEMLQQAAAKVCVFQRREADLQVLKTQFGQARMLAEAEAWDLVLSVYNWVKRRGKRNPAIRKHFHVLYAQFARKPKAAKKQPPTDAEPSADPK